MSASPAIYNDLNGLTSLRSQAHRDPSKNLREAATQFEALFIQNMLKGARAASLAPGALDGPHSDTYKEMYDQQLALTLAKGRGIGIADMLVRQLQGPVNHQHNTGHSMAPPLHVIRTTPAAYSATNSSPSPTDPSEGVRDASASAPPQKAPSPTHYRTPEEFVASVWPAACDAANKLGVDPKVLVAQAAVESGWGRSVAHRNDGTSSHNLFGIKADGRWSGARTIVSTLEYEDGVAVRRQDPFRSYDSFSDSFADYAHFLQSNPRYQTALDQAKSPEAFLQGLQRAGYATDPAYAKKVASVLHGSTLQTALANLNNA